MLAADSQLHSGPVPTGWCSAHQPTRYTCMYICRCLTRNQANDMIELHTCMFLLLSMKSNTIYKFTMGMKYMIAERLSTRQLILHRISEIVSMYVCMFVCMYPSCLGMQLFRALHANVCAHVPV